MKPKFFILPIFLYCLLYLLNPNPMLAGKSGVTIRISDFQRDSLQRLKAIKEVTESPQITMDLNISNIAYSANSPSQVEGYQMNIRVLNVSARNYPPESYQISKIKYSSIGRVSSFEYFGRGVSVQCTATDTHHMVAPISRKNNNSPPMLALSTPARGAMNTLFGRDFQNVTVKTDPVKQRYALEIQNEVFALARDLYFSENGDQRIIIPFSCTQRNIQNQPM